jgi:hypothetical protein
VFIRGLIASLLIYPTAVLSHHVLPDESGVSIAGRQLSGTWSETRTSHVSQSAIWISAWGFRLHQTPWGQAVEGGNLYKQDGKEWRAGFAICMDARNMVTSEQSATRQAVETMPLPLDDRSGRIAWYKIGSPGRIIARLRAALEARAPVGYEDDCGFHYGPDATGWFFTI